MSSSESIINLFDSSLVNPRDIPTKDLNQKYVVKEGNLKPLTEIMPFSAMEGLLTDQDRSKFFNKSTGNSPFGRWGMKGGKEKHYREKNIK